MNLHSSSPSSSPWLPHSKRRLCVAAVLLAGLGTMLTACSRQTEETPPLENQVLQTQPPRPAPPRVVRQARPRVASEDLNLDATSAQSPLPIYELTIDPNHLAALEQNPFGNQTVPAAFAHKGENYPTVQVRHRGAWARTWPKKPLKIFFPKEKPFQEQRCLNLNSAWHDPALVREILAYHVYQASGAPASRARMIRLHVNGRFRGLYVEVEQPDQAFLRERGLKGAAVYKASSRARQGDERELPSERAYMQHYEKQTKKSEPYADLQEFCRDLARTQDAEEFFNRHVDVEKYINYLAATALVQNWDGFNKNHFLVHDLAGSGKWLVLPWDLDRTFGDHWNWSFTEARLSPLLGTEQKPGVTGWNRLQDRFFSRPVFQNRFLDRLQELLEKEFTPEKLFPVLDELQTQMAADAALDRRRWPVADPDLEGAIDQVKRYIEQRRAYLLAEIPRLRRS